MKLLCLSLTLALALVCAAWAGSPMPVQMKCPVGGKKFTYISTATSSQWGSRPDGKPYGSWTFPMPLPECPDNGLVMYREFKPAEIKLLKKLLASSEYRQLLSNADVPYYRAYWLMGKLGEVAVDQVWVLQQAAWEADLRPELKKRYQDEFVQRVRALPRPEDAQGEMTWIVMSFRAANALRELARFDEALQLLDAVPTASLDVPVPAEKVIGTTESGLGKKIENYGEIRAAQSRRSWLSYPEQQRVAIARHDSSSEPIDMVPLRVAMDLCLTYPRSTPEYQKVCESEAMRAQLARAKKMRELMSQPAAPATPAPTPTPAETPKPD
jgi:hypothetical protein